jgi:hypothetical protein
MSRIDVPPPEDHVSRSVVGFRIGAKCMVIAKTTGKPWPTVEDVDAGGRAARIPRNSPGRPHYFRQFRMLSGSEASYRA